MPSPYRAPEVVADSPARLDNPQAADVFSAGVVLFVMIFGVPPFRSASLSDPHYIHFVHDNEYFWNLFKTPAISKDLKDMINHLLDHDMTTRATLNQIKTLPWFTNQVMTRRMAQAAMRRMHVPYVHP